MQRSKWIGIVLAVCVFGTSQFASAVSNSINPNACRLVSNTSPYPEISGSLGGSGMFTNNSGSTAWAMCPVVWQNGFNNFMVAGSSTSASCYLIVVGTGGASTVYFGTRTGNTVAFSNTLNPGSYSAEIQCFIPSGQSIYSIINY
jgi:hypothetical protein